MRLVRILHLYPFVPAGRHGGTLRLRAALAASARLGEPELHYFDAADRTWRGPAQLDPTPAAVPVAEPGLKRRIFPSTLWESGRAAVAAAPLDRLALGSGAVLVLHTTPLAPLLRRLPAQPARSVVDVYDLVWRAHANDAAAGTAGARPVRGAYAAAVRARELSAVRRAGALLVAGNEDHEWLADRHPDAHWVPTATPIEPVEPRPAGTGPLRVGLLGNFAHQSTRASAELLLASELAADPEATIVLAGLHSEDLPRPAGVEVLGTIARAESFYAEVDCVVAPVVGGSGMKVKLAEALLAGRPVVTTPLGAEGYPARMSRHFTLAGPRSLDLALARRAIARFDPLAARANLEPELCWDAVLGRYERALG